MRNLLDITDFTPAELDSLMALADDMIARPGTYAHCMSGKKLATLFFEPSTRTRLSFEAAMLELGGNVIGFESASTSSAAKGESVADTVRVVGNYCDVIAMRHPSEGAPYVAAEYSPVPIINAGDGGHTHPTQTLADLLTIRREMGGLRGLTVGLCGDLRYGRTVHSLIRALVRCDGVRFVLISPKELALPPYMLEHLRSVGARFTVCTSLAECIRSLDVLYMTRVQKERFTDPSGFGVTENAFVLTPEIMARAKGNMRVLHPLPRVNEIDPAVDSDPRAAYFRQTFYGKIMRKALILRLVESAGKPDVIRREKRKGFRCLNPKCITNAELFTPCRAYQTANGFACAYCDASAEQNDR